VTLIPVGRSTEWLPEPNTGSVLVSDVGLAAVAACFPARVADSYRKRGAVPFFPARVNRAAPRTWCPLKNRPE
jgi:hypothetical protein